MDGPLRENQKFTINELEGNSQRTEKYLILFLLTFSTVDGNSKAFRDDNWLLELHIIVPKLKGNASILRHCNFPAGNH